MLTTRLRLAAICTLRVPANTDQGHSRLGSLFAIGHAGAATSSQVTLADGSGVHIGVWLIFGGITGRGTSRPMEPNAD